MVRKQLSEFKKFILRGNVVDLAVGVAIGAAFNNIVNALVKDFITPLVGAVTGKEKFAEGTFHFRGQAFPYGDFINVLVTFLITAAVIFFFIVQPINRLTALANKGKNTEDPSTKKCPECLSEIPKDARRCKFCTTQLIGDKDSKPSLAKKPVSKPISSL